MTKYDPLDQEQLEFLHGGLEDQLNWSRAGRSRGYGRGHGRAATLNRTYGRFFPRALNDNDSGPRSCRQGRVACMLDPSIVKTQATVIVLGPSLCIHHLKAMFPNDGSPLSSVALPCQIICVVVFFTIDYYWHGIAAGDDATPIRRGGGRCNSNNWHSWGSWVSWGSWGS